MTSKNILKNTNIKQSNKINNIIINETNIKQRKKTENLTELKKTIKCISFWFFNDAINLKNMEEMQRFEMSQ